MLLPLKHALRRLAGPSYLKKRYLVAVSGGMDSMVLLHLLQKILPASQIVVGHFDHSVRKTSAQDAKFVKAYAKRHGLVFVQAKRRGKQLSEDGLRNERLAFLTAARVSQKADFVLTAHHANDQWETMMMRLIRGTGLRGLSGIAPRRGTWLRPFLTVSRKQIERFAHSQSIAFRQDASNFLPLYFRNRIRKELAPVFFKLASEFGSEETFFNRNEASLKEFRATEKYLSKVSKSEFKRLVVITPFWARIATQDLVGLETLIQERVIRLTVEKLNVATLNRIQLKRVLKAIKSGKGIHVSGLKLESSCGFVYLKSSHATVGNDVQIRTSGNQHCIPLLGISLEANTSSGCELRFFQAGDHFRNKKMKRLFLERRIPAPERALVPVLARQDSGEILWWLAEGETEGVRVKTVDFPFSAQCLGSKF